MNKAYLLLGSNLGDSHTQLLIATNNINELVGKVVRTSGLYKTEPWGNTDQPYFLNQVVEVETTLTASQMLQKTLAIENLLGRTRQVKNEPRVIDIDILFFNHEIINETELTIPHPALHLRRFVLVPLSELAPRFVHPLFHKTISRLLKECPDKLDVNKI